MSFKSIFSHHFYIQKKVCVYSIDSNFLFLTLFSNYRVYSLLIESHSKMFNYSFSVSDTMSLKCHHIYFYWLLWYFSTSQGIVGSHTYNFRKIWKVQSFCFYIKLWHICSSSPVYSELDPNELIVKNPLWVHRPRYRPRHPVMCRRIISNWESRPFSESRNPTLRKYNALIPL